MITLYVFGPAFDLPEASHFCMKSEVQLKMAGLAYRKDTAGFPNAPKGKLPYIEDAGVRVPDSNFIRGHIETAHGIDLDQGLGPVARSQGWAIERLCEDHLGWAMAWFRWLVPENFAKGPAHFFDQAPEGMRERLRAEALAKVDANMRAHGIGRHSPDEIAALGNRSIEALSGMLGDQPYMLGDEPAAADAIAFATLACVLSRHFDTPLRRRAEELPNLPAYVARMMARFYPEWVQAAQPKAAVAA